MNPAVPYHRACPTTHIATSGKCSRSNETTARLVQIRPPAMRSLRRRSVSFRARSAMNTYQHLSELQALIGSTLGTSDWLHIDQSRIDQFAAVTGDDQWIHVDPVRAAAGPFRSTV